jgi:MYXO-CTERM domain-containing protein
VNYRKSIALVPSSLLLLFSQVAWSANPPTPSGGHPRLYLTDARRAALLKNAGTNGTAAANLVAQCDDVILHPVTDRGGADAFAWPSAALNCALAYLATQDQKYLDASIKYWHTSLDDDQTQGDHLGCVAGVDANWQMDWDGTYPPPPVLLTVMHDTGYPMRWYGPFLALTYDWLYGAPGVDDALRAQTRVCLTAWMDEYTKNGFMNDVPGTNYNAGYLIGKTLSAIAIGTDGGADGHLWNETLDDAFGKVLIGTGDRWTPAGGNNFYVYGGLVGGDKPPLSGPPIGALVGGDWGSWQYGPLSVLEYSAATVALEEQGVALPQMDDWASSLFLRYAHGTVPTRDAEYAGCGDLDSPTPYQTPTVGVLDAVLLGPVSDQVAAWALAMKNEQGQTGSVIWDALAEARAVTPLDYRSQTPPPPLWYLSRGSRSVYARTAWDTQAYWGVFSSPPALLDHQHFSASSFVFSRGADHLIVDPAPYGGNTSWESNAVTADSSVVEGDYAPSQTPWSEAELPWARGTADAVFAARSDFSKAFIMAGTPSDISYAHREWVMLPEGEVVTLDRVHTSAASRNTHISFHTNTGAGGLTLSGGVASGAVGGSRVVIHPVLLSGGTPEITQPSTGDCMISCNTPCAACDIARFAVDKYAVTVPGPWSVAIHVIDGLEASETPALVGSLNDDNFDPAPKRNAAVVGAAVYRGEKQSYVVASSAQDGVSPATLSYDVLGSSPGRHIVFDAPEAADGSSTVTASVDGDRCAIQIVAGAGGGFAGQPLMFSVSSAADGCVAQETTSVAPGEPPPGSGLSPDPLHSSDAGTPSPSPSPSPSQRTPAASPSSKSGCGCRVPAAPPDSKQLALSFTALALVLSRRRRRAAGTQ